MVSVRIPLTQGKFARVSIEDAERVMAFKWHVRKDRKTDYAVRVERREGRVVTIKMHQVIAGKGCDHKNRDGLDCRRSNLRRATTSQQSMNQGVRSDNTSGHRGVSWNKREGKWHARIMVDGKQKHLGFFPSLREAVAIREQAEIDCFGEFRPM